jgi:ABC-type dipeptide/oligopeptide/nickel transport system ATPase component
VTNLGENLLEVQDLKLYFKVKAGKVRAVDGVSFAIKPGEKVGIVGESGCGKSVTALSIMRLIPQPPGEYAGGSVLFEDQDLLEMPESAMRKIRGSRIGMIFQDPMTCLNPTMPVGKQIAEGLRIHLKLYLYLSRWGYQMPPRVLMPIPINSVVGCASA